ncbi:MAG: hypothetical protein PHI27_08785 [Eubacteriales bacterium]|nr:hypothetical protein [Eubacteriales bacterium]MDD3882335.1 hypothetical protein [Eubacteriales bacterium]MDD4512081.1 hypothetical protein [Eubacteriales bacterium]
MAKKILKGFKSLHYLPIATTNGNDETHYAVSTAVALPGAMNCTRADTRNDVKINADDTVYLTDSDFTEAKLDIEVAGISLADLAALTGATYDTEAETLTEKITDAAPYVALTFAAALADGEGSRLFQYFCCKCTGVKSDVKTAGQSTEASTVTLTFSCVGRLCDGAVRATKDFDMSASDSDRSAFLTSITAVTPA